MFLTNEKVLGVSDLSEAQRLALKMSSASAKPLAEALAVNIVGLV